jgi:hypothetical protein
VASRLSLGRAVGFLGLKGKGLATGVWGLGGRCVAYDGAALVLQAAAVWALFWAAGMGRGSPHPLQKSRPRERQSAPQSTPIRSNGGAAPSACATRSPARAADWAMRPMR